MWISVLEDEAVLNNLITKYLQKEGYSVRSYLRGEDAVQGLDKPTDLWVIDIMLPDIDGFTVFREVQRKNPNSYVIFISARNQDIDRLAGLELGGDDYISKPFGTSELLARVRTAIRHARGAGNGQGGTQAVTFLEGRLVIDHDKHRVFVDGEDAGLTQNEFKLVSLLGKYAGKVLTYDYMMKEIWGPNMKNDNRILRVNMANIRRKIEKNPAQPEFIFTEIGVGYRFVEADVQAKEKK